MLVFRNKVEALVSTVRLRINCDQYFDFINRIEDGAVYHAIAKTFRRRLQMNGYLIMDCGSNAELGEVVT